MDIKELEDVMALYGVVLRAIPKVPIRGVYEKRHIDIYPTGRIEYLPEYKREMLVVETMSKQAGKFLYEFSRGTTSGVNFSGKKYFDTIELAIEDILKEKYDNNEGISNA